MKLHTSTEYTFVPNFQKKKNMRVACAVHTPKIENSLNNMLKTNFV